MADPKFDDYRAGVEGFVRTRVRPELAALANYIKATFHLPAVNAIDFVYRGLRVSQISLMAIMSLIESGKIGLSLGFDMDAHSSAKFSRGDTAFQRSHQFRHPDR